MVEGVSAGVGTATRTQSGSSENEHCRLSYTSSDSSERCRCTLNSPIGKSRTRAVRAEGEDEVEVNESCEVAFGSQTRTSGVPSFASSFSITPHLYSTFTSANALASRLR